jgi:hypothetical protein
MPKNSVHVRLTPDQRDALDELRRRLPNLPSGPEALRQALQQALAALRDEPGDLAGAQ